VVLLVGIIKVPTGGMQKERPGLTTQPQQLKYGDKTHVLQSSSESHRYELYRSSGAGGDDDDDDDDNRELEFAGLINHSLSVQKADHVTAGVDSALEQLRTSMAAISEIKEANKYASPVVPGLSRACSGSLFTSLLL
jgi:hypothetical protein